MKRRDLLFGLVEAAARAVVVERAGRCVRPPFQRAGSASTRHTTQEKAVKGT
jgi:hypothetical protein